LHDVFRQLEVMQSEYAGERGDHPARLMSEKMVARLHF